MTKNIILCADGTWNGPEDADATEAPSISNVLKLFRNLDGNPQAIGRDPEQEKSQPEQVAKYLHGVGDSNNALVKLFEGTTGAGVVDRVVRGYTFVSRNFVPGDRIYLVGFSRGAYTVRALGGMIGKMGLLDARRTALADKDAAYKLGARVWHQYRDAAPRPPSGWRNWVRDIASGDRLRFLADPVPADVLVKTGIEAVAVWDTVGALGIPVYASGTNDRVDLFQFADTALSAMVRHGYHAVSLDDQREDFVPTLWDDDPRVTQVLFPGAHADVGGGYPAGAESGLSDCALEWMTAALTGAGVRFAAHPVNTPAPRADAPAHQPWRSGVWAHTPTGMRSIRPGLGLSRWVLERMQAGLVKPDPGGEPEPYFPPNLGHYLAPVLRPDVQVV